MLRFTYATLKGEKRAQVFSLFDAVTCGGFLKVLADAHRQTGKQRAAGADAGSDTEMEDADAADVAGEPAGGRGSDWCAEAVSAFAAALPLLSLKDQQDTLRRCSSACVHIRLASDPSAVAGLCFPRPARNPAMAHPRFLYQFVPPFDDIAPGATPSRGARSCIETLLEIARSPAAGAAIVEACHKALLALVAPCHGQPADTAAILLRHLTPAVLGVAAAGAGDAGEAIKTSAGGPSKAVLTSRSRALRLAKTVLECALAVPSVLQDSWFPPQPLFS